MTGGVGVNHRSVTSVCSSCENSVNLKSFMQDISEDFIL